MGNLSRRTITTENISSLLSEQLQRASEAGVPQIENKKIRDIILQMNESVFGVVLQSTPRLLIDSKAKDEECEYTLVHFWEKYGRELYTLLFPLFQARLKTVYFLVQVFNALYSKEAGYIILKSRANVFRIMNNLEKQGLIPELDVYDIRKSKTYSIKGINEKLPLITDKSLLVFLLSGSIDTLLQYLSGPGGISQKWKRFAQDWNKKNAKKHQCFMFEDYTSLCTFLDLPDTKLSTLLGVIHSGLYEKYERSFKPRKSGMRILNKKIPFATSVELQSGPFRSFLIVRFAKIMKSKKNARDAFREVCMLWNTEYDNEGIIRAGKYGYNIPTSIHPPSTSNTSSWEQYYENPQGLTLTKIFQSFGLRLQDGKLVNMEATHDEKMRNKKKSIGLLAKSGSPKTYHPSSIGDIRDADFFNNYEKIKKEKIMALSEKINQAYSLHYDIKINIVNKLIPIERYNELFLISYASGELLLSISMHLLHGSTGSFFSRILGGITCSEFTLWCGELGMSFQSENTFSFFKK